MLVAIKHGTSLLHKGLCFPGPVAFSVCASALMSLPLTIQLVGAFFFFGFVII